MNPRIIFFDTTLRDGEQSPGVSLDLKQKVEIGKALAELGIDVIEGGFPITSPGDFEAVKTLAKEIKGVTIAALARANKKDIEVAWEALKSAESPRIHTFIATSDIHLKYKLKKSRSEVLEIAREAVKYALSFCPDVEFSAEDATRSDWDYLAQIILEVVKVGAKTINIPDTVGYVIPHEYYNLIKFLAEKLISAGYEEDLRNGSLRISVHCHNDLGLAVANSLSAILAGATQVEGTINGIGERAGNAALEEIIMTIKTRNDFFEKKLGYPLQLHIDTRKIVPISQLVSKYTGMIVQPNKAIVGTNAFAHESGIHQHGVICERSTYEIISPEEVGWTGSAIVLGKHSGRHAIGFKLKSKGWQFDDEVLSKVFGKFKIEIKDVLKKIDDEYLEGILIDLFLENQYRYKLVSSQVISVHSGSLKPIAQVEIEDKKEGKKVSVGLGVGPIDAAYKAVAEALGYSFDRTDGKRFLRLIDFHISALTGGTSAEGVCGLIIEDEKGLRTAGLGKDGDIVIASLKALLKALNRLEAFQEKGEELKNRVLTFKT
ncbi:MAG: Isopropylmalate/homocitrate/citramalate synthase [Thermodesulfobacterium sp.]|uniref:2-isopropylmalate synthase n=1 Tax=Candidatus Thermodesulfobacterium syntrophicum TaxID=3060442 RepID=A0AAE3P2R0_9BACT|nr:Isopropylmalate/homocitrate/citramalate synthase [Candidatus Thermodesulfobacterium syntrophicum]